MLVKKTIHAVLTAGVVVGVVLAGATAANATTEYPEGGTWNYGVHFVGDHDEVYSHYYHGSRTHKATACATSGCTATAWKTSGSWAEADRNAGLWGNTAYYDVQ